MAWGDTYGYWGDSLGSWGTNITVGNNSLSVNALKPVLSIQAGGKLSLVALVPSATLAGSKPSVGTFSVSALSPTLNMTGILGRIGTLSVNALLPVLSLSGFTSTSGVFSNTALKFIPNFRTFARTPTGEDIYNCIVICLENGANSIYSNFDFNSIAKYGDTVLLAGPNGIYTLGGTDDDGTEIASIIKTFTDDFGLDNLKRVPECYIGLKGGPLMIEVIRDGDAGELQIMENTGTDLRNRRVKTGRGDKFRYWAVQIKNVNGADFLIDNITLPSVYVSKRKLVE